MMVSWNNPMVKGVLIGVGASLVGFAVYKHNEEKVDAFLNRHGVKVKTPTAGFETMSVEDLMRTKETIEDLIAEKELQEQSVTVEGAGCCGGKRKREEFISIGAVRLKPDSSFHTSKKTALADSATPAAGASD